MNAIYRNGGLAIVYGMLCIPLFYFVYKYFVPAIGMIDFYDYYKLYKTMDVHAVDCPLNMRLISSSIVFLMSKTGLYYHTRTAMETLGFENLYYFNAVLLNYICVVLTCVLIYRLVNRTGLSMAASFLCGLTYLLGFGTIFFELTPLSDALAVLIFALFLLSYNRQSYLVFLPLTALIIQREYLLLAVPVMCIVDFYWLRDKYYLKVMAAAIACFIAHVVLRKMYFQTVHYGHHIKLEYILQSFVTLRVHIGPMVRQTLLTMNIPLIYFGVVVYKLMRGLAVQMRLFTSIVLMLAQVVLLTFLLALGNNNGRYFYMVTPFIIFALAQELRSFFPVMSAMKQ